MSDVQQALPTFGRELIPTLDKTYFDDCVCFIAPEAWELAKFQFHFPPKQVIEPKSMELARLERVIDRAPHSETVFGIGGGSACDAAKLFAAKVGARLILVPTILSVDAPFTKAVGVRIGGRVRYVEQVFPAHLLLDFDLLQKAPVRLNRAGVGDILSIYTALADWRLAAAQTGEAFDDALAAEAQMLLDRLFAGAAAIRNNTEEGLRLLAELYVAEVRLCERHGNSRPEEGSEHSLAYCLEWLVRKPFRHGELIALSVLLTAAHQDQPLEPVRRFLHEVEVEFRPGSIGVAEQEIKQALLALPRYLQEEQQLLYGVFHRRGMTEADADRLLGRLHECID